MARKKITNLNDDFDENEHQEEDSFYYEDDPSENDPAVNLPTEDDDMFGFPEDDKEFIENEDNLDEYGTDNIDYNFFDDQF